MAAERGKFAVNRRTTVVRSVAGMERLVTLRLSRQSVGLESQLGGLLLNK